MAGLKLCIPFRDLDLVPGSWKTLASFKAGSDQCVRLERVRLGLGGTSGTAKPMDFRIQPVTASSGTGTTITPSKRNRTNGTTPRSVCRIDFSVEPTSTANAEIGADKFHGQGGEYQDFTFDDVVTEAAGEMAVQVFTIAAEPALKASGHVFIEE